MSDPEATEQTTETARRPTRSERRRTRRHARAEAEIRRPFRRMLPNLLLAAVIFFLTALILSERPLPLPDRVAALIAEDLNERFDNDTVSIGRISVSLGAERGAEVQLRNVRMGTPGDGAAAVLNTVSASLLPDALLRGAIRPAAISLNGAQVTLRRAADGRFAFAGGVDGDRNLALSDLLGLLDEAMAGDMLASVREIIADGVVLTVEDARSGRIWQATNARTVLRRTETGLTLSLTSDVFNGTDNVAEVQLSFDFTSETQDTSLGVRVSNMPADEIALQSPVLAWLGVLDAPLSGAVRAEYSGADGLTSLAGTLDIAAGALSPVEGSDPQPFDAARAYFRFDPARQRLNFSELSVSSESLTLDATGHTYLSELEGGWPTAFIGQFRVGGLRFADTGLLEGAVTLTDLTADMRLRLDPFTVDLAQVTAPNGGHPVRANAHIEARRDGWSLAVDAETEAIAPDTVLAFWPLREAPGTRNWLSRNVRSGRLTDVTSAIRKTAGERATIALSFDIEGGEVRFLPEMPPITGGHGRATLMHDTFTLVLDEGEIDVPGGDRVDGAGSMLTVPDIEEKPARGIFEIRASGDLTDVFRVLDKPPVRLLDRIDKDIDFATGEAEIAARLELPLVRNLPVAELSYQVAGTLRGAASETLALGRRLTADAARIEIDPEAISLWGAMGIDGVPVTANWRQALGGGAGAGSRAMGSVRLSPETLTVFDVPLPEGMFGGAAQADFTLDLPADAAPRLTLASDMLGASLRLDGLGWTKARDVAASFALEAVLGEALSVPAFSLEAPGLDLAGRGATAGGGAIDRLTLDRLRLGQWLDASAEVALVPGAPGLSLTGGSLDLRNLPDLGGQGGGGGRDVDVSLDQLIVSESIRIGPFRGALETGQFGPSGDFQGRLNGGTVIRAVLAPTPAGTGIRVQANDAGGVLRDARLTPNASGGTLDIVLTPVRDAPDGTYNGQFLIENISLKDAPVMAALLDAASVVGLLDRLGGSGIQFSTVDGQFRLTPDRLTLRDVAATGASLGISANGVYDMAAGRMDLEGVVSPFYFLNAVGNLVSRRGEGLFGVNYRVSGEVSRPRISVNPLSILTPGAFRQIFRRAPPTE